MALGDYKNVCGSETKPRQILIVHETEDFLPNLEVLSQIMDSVRVGNLL